VTDRIVFSQFLKQANGLDLGKLLTAYTIYYNVVHDRLSVTDASAQLDELMVAPPKYNLWQSLIIGALASAFIQPSGKLSPLTLTRSKRQLNCSLCSFLRFLHRLFDGNASRSAPRSRSSDRLSQRSLRFTVRVSPLFCFIPSRQDTEQLLASQNRYRLHHFLPRRRYRFIAEVLFRRCRIGIRRPHSSRLHRSVRFSRTRKSVDHFGKCSTRLLDSILALPRVSSASSSLISPILTRLGLCRFGLSIGSEIYARITTIDTIPGYGDYTCSAIRNANPPWYMDTIPAWWCKSFLLPCHLSIFD